MAQRPKIHTPWRVSEHRKSSLAICDRNDREVATVALNKYTDNSGVKQRANIMVRAVNSYEPMIEALKLADEILRDNTSIDVNWKVRERISAALKLAKGETQ